MTEKLFFDRKNGHTLIELIVALAVFSMAILAVVGIFLIGMSGVQRIFNDQNIQEATRYITESMGKELRMSIINTAPGGPYSSINITNTDGETFDYVFNGITHQINRGGQILNSDKIKIDGAFYIQRTGTTEPRITIIINAEAVAAKESQQSRINLQTTLSSRQYEQ
ncbi:MAG: hypothetical protein UV36_C0035G0002 [Parcubacteria group bacterium GW2011_GWC2_42_6]|nr:MAG: hypothetical protein UV36_C0035G0002 [Parcubacteria group bacterium GW2011_GWC2_42_6]